MRWLTMARWSPYGVGAGIGLLVCLALLLSDRLLGCSTAFARTSGMLERLLLGRKVLEKPYYRAFVPTIEWEWMLMLGVFLGASLSARAAGLFQVQWVPQLWAHTAGHGVFMRWIVAFTGGTVMGFGARWAGGCTSGHGISGTMQLAVSSWMAACCFFIGGIAMAHFLFKVLLS